MISILAELPVSNDVAFRHKTGWLNIFSWVSWLNGFSSGRGTARAEDAQGRPTQSHISPSTSIRRNNFKGGTWDDAGLVLERRDQEVRARAVAHRRDNPCSGFRV